MNVQVSSTKVKILHNNVGTSRYYFLHKILAIIAPFSLFTGTRISWLL